MPAKSSQSEGATHTQAAKMAPMWSKFSSTDLTSLKKEKGGVRDGQLAVKMAKRDDVIPTRKIILPFFA